MSTPDLQDDRSVFLAISRGDDRAFHILFDRYKSRVYASAFKWTQSHSDAEEITQDVFIRIWTGRRLLTDISDPKAYIYRIIYNRVKDFFRSALSREKIMAHIRKHQALFSNNTEEAILAHESAQLINEAISRLSPQKQQIYHLARSEGKSYQEIAEALDISPNTVKGHLREATLFIRTYLRNAALGIGFLVSTLFR